MPEPEVGGPFGANLGNTSNTLPQKIKLKRGGGSLGI